MTGKIKIDSNVISNIFGTKEFDVADHGTGMAKLQIDLYWGEDHPSSPANIRVPAGAATYENQEDQAVILLDFNE